MLPIVKSVYCLVLFVAGICSQPVFIVQPISTTVVDGSEVEFTCVAMNSVAVLYFVDDTAASVNSIVGKGFTEQNSESLEDGSIRRNLTAIASANLNNNSAISCRALSPEVDSEIAILLVQGQLSPVGSISSFFIDSSTVNVSWSPPFTLPGTDIAGYNISATSNGTTTNNFTSNSYYVLLLTDITDSPCSEIIITVSGYNGLDGENESLAGIYLPSVPSGDVSIPVSISTVNESLSLIVTINVSGLCIGEHPSSIDLALSSNETFKDIPVPEATNNILTITDITSVNEDERFTATVAFKNLARYFTINSTVDFNSFGVQSATITDSTDGRVCLECVFSSLSAETGCTCTAISTIVSSRQYSESFARSDDTASGCIDIPGIDGSEVFNISITDQGDEAVAYSLTAVTVAAMMSQSASSTVSQTVSVSSSSSSSSIPGGITTPTSDQVQSDNTIIIIGAAVPIVVIIFALTILIIILVMVVHKKKKSSASTGPTKHRENSSEAFISSNDFDSRSPTTVNPPADGTYSVPNKKPTYTNTTLVYAELSEIRKPPNKNGSAPPPKKDNSKVVYSDLLIKGQPPPPPYEPVKPGVTVIPPSKEPEIVEFFFNQNDNDDIDGSGKDSNKYTDPAIGGNDPMQYPPPPSERAPSPPTEDTFDQPPPIPSRTQLNHDNRLPDVVRHDNHPYTEEGYTDESLNPAREEFRNHKDDAHFSGSGYYKNTPTATFL